MNKLYLKQIPHLLLLIFCCSTFSLQAQEEESTTIWDRLTPSEYLAGFKILKEYDHSRSYQEAEDYFGQANSTLTSRPLLVYIWYPAKKVRKPKYMPFAHYLDLENLREEFNLERSPEEQLEQSLDMAASMLWNLETDITEEDLVLAPTRAVLEAEPASGKFPLLIYAPSFSATPIDNILICEYLASHGYIVVSTPSASKCKQEMTLDQEGIMAQVEDLEFLKGLIQRDIHVNIEKIGTLGFSWGGLTNVLFQMRNHYVDAVVSYDGAIEYYQEVFDDLFFFDENKLSVPYLFMARKDIPDSNFKFYHSVDYADAMLLQFNELDHAGFGSFYSFLTTIQPNGFDFDTRGTEAMAHYTLQFFDAHLKGKQSSTRYLMEAPENNGWEENFLTTQSKIAQKSPPTEAQFVQIIEEYGFSRAYKEFKYFKKAKPSLQLFTENNMNSLGYEYLLNKGDLETAIEIFKLNVEAYPKSYHVYDNLGEAYREAGAIDDAIDNYFHSLELNPRNKHAQVELNELMDMEEEPKRDVETLHGTSPNVPIAIPEKEPKMDVGGNYYSPEPIEMPNDKDEKTLEEEEEEILEDKEAIPEKE